MITTRFLKALLAVAAICFATSASAQESTETFEKKRALEITTGHPSILFSLDFPWAHSQAELWEEGKDIKTYFQPCLNIAYVYNWRKRWELSTILNLHPSIHDVYEKSNPNNYVRDYKVGGSLSLAFRYKWLLRENVEMYSALGLGIVSSFPLPLPYIAPVGIKFGKGKVYGLVEANMSTTSNYGIVGIGIRL